MFDFDDEWDGVEDNKDEFDEGGKSCDTHTQLFFVYFLWLSLCVY